MKTLSPFARQCGEPGCTNLHSKYSTRCVEHGTDPTPPEDTTPLPTLPTPKLNCTHCDAEIPPHVAGDVHSDIEDLPSQYKEHIFCKNEVDHETCDPHPAEWPPICRKCFTNKCEEVEPEFECHACGATMDKDDHEIAGRSYSLPPNRPGSDSWLREQYGVLLDHPDVTGSKPKDESRDYEGNPTICKDCWDSLPAYPDCDHCGNPYDPESNDAADVHREYGRMDEFASEYLQNEHNFSSARYGSYPDLCEDCWSSLKEKAEDAAAEYYCTECGNRDWSVPKNNGVCDTCDTESCNDCGADFDKDDAALDEDGYCEDCVRIPCDDCGQEKPNHELDDQIRCKDCHIQPCVDCGTPVRGDDERQRREDFHDTIPENDTPENRSWMQHAGYHKGGKGNNTIFDVPAYQCKDCEDRHKAQHFSDPETCPRCLDHGVRCPDCPGKVSPHRGKTHPEHVADEEERARVVAERQERARATEEERRRQEEIRARAAEIGVQRAQWERDNPGHGLHEMPLHLQEGVDWDSWDPMREAARIRREREAKPKPAENEASRNRFRELMRRPEEPKNETAEQLKRRLEAEMPSDKDDSDISKAADPKCSVCDSQMTGADHLKSQEYIGKLPKQFQRAVNQTRPFFHPAGSPTRGPDGRMAVCEPCAKNAVYKHPAKYDCNLCGNEVPQETHHKNWRSWVDGNTQHSDAMDYDFYKQRYMEHATDDGEVPQRDESTDSQGDVVLCKRCHDKFDSPVRCAGCGSYKDWKDVDPLVSEYDGDDRAMYFAQEHGIGGEDRHVCTDCDTRLNEQWQREKKPCKSMNDRNIECGAEVDPQSAGERFDSARYSANRHPGLAQHLDKLEEHTGGDVCRDCFRNHVDEHRHDPEDCEFCANPACETCSRTHPGTHDEWLRSEQARYAAEQEDMRNWTRSRSMGMPSSLHYRPPSPRLPPLSPHAQAFWDENHKFAESKKEHPFHTAQEVWNTIMRHKIPTAEHEDVKDEFNRHMDDAVASKAPPQRNPDYVPHKPIQDARSRFAPKKE